MDTRRVENDGGIDHRLWNKKGRDVSYVLLAGATVEEEEELGSCLDYFSIGNRIRTLPPSTVTLWDSKGIEGYMTSWKLDFVHRSFQDYVSFPECPRTTLLILDGKILKVKRNLAGLIECCPGHLCLTLLSQPPGYSLWGRLRLTGG